MAVSFEDVAKTIASELRSVATTESIVGDPIEIQGKTIIPVIKLKMGFGAGSGEDTGEQKKHGHGGSGGGGGGGVTVEPVAFITIIGDQISVLSPKGAKFEKLAETVPGIVSKIMDIKAKAESNKPEEHSDAEE
jgi:uncharacterized spore protein YtfJ